MIRIFENSKDLDGKQLSAFTKEDLSSILEVPKFSIPLVYSEIQKAKGTFFQTNSKGIPYKKVTKR